MPFEVMLRGSHRGSPSERRNPFTGEPAVVVPLEMTDAELAATVAVIRRHEGTVADGIRLPEASLSWVDFDREGALVALRGSPKAWAPVLFDLADAGNLAVLSCASAPLAVTSAATLERLRRWEEMAEEIAADAAVIVCDAAALARHLAADAGEADGFVSRALRDV